MDLKTAEEYYNNDNYKEALPIFNDLCKDKNKDGCYFLGLMYFNGQGVEKNLETAIMYWKKAEKLGSQDANYMLQSHSMSTICKC